MYGHSARRLFLAVCALMLASMTGACSPADVLNFLSPKQGYEATKSVAYGTSPRQSLDVYRPAGKERAPVIVFFYGGSWQTGSKETYLFAAASLSKLGYVVVVPDYRLYPEVLYPGFIEDGALAVRWAKENAARFGGDPEKIFLMGHSAGAYIAAMLAIDGRWLKASGLDAQLDIAGLIGVAGPYDFLPLKDETLKIIFGGAGRTETLPINYVKPGTPPALLVTAKNDNTVDPGNSSRLGERLRASGNSAEVLVYSGGGHLAILGSLARPLQFIAPLRRDVDAFIVHTSAARSATGSRN